MKSIDASIPNRFLFRRVWDMPNPDTFDGNEISGFVQKYLMKSRVSVDPFARNKRWATHTNDLNPNTAAEFHLDALEFLKEMKFLNVQADLVIFDPPYSVCQVKECYESIGIEFQHKDTQRTAAWTPERDLINKLLTKDGIVLSFGWNSIGMGKERGFEIIEGLLVCHGSTHHDTICMAERRIPDYQLTLPNV